MEFKNLLYAVSLVKHVVVQMSVQDLYPAGMPLPCLVCKKMFQTRFRDVLTETLSACLCLCLDSDEI